MYCYATSVGAGFKGGFCYGPIDRFEASCLLDDLVAFQVELGGEPRLAVDEMVADANVISKPLFIVLAKAHHAMKKILGQPGVAPQTRQYVDDLARIIDAAPFMIDRTRGVVEKVEAAVDEMPYAEPKF